ncbi:acetyl-CoA C-acyltransferase [Yinghuangia seranimata]|uniref:acetyl-CoA C-acyltransferase n=1 Tax=Yinghuangia seranimata TaxID=408067 RepID=UPI00248BBF31|nr:acetyl-CoA C-acyltransferase [Yinghuangia seranimata]MDI2125881.1 acetyl-CoA C-acyltransferase [Yinghuangia seranimata]
MTEAQSADQAYLLAHVRTPRGKASARGALASVPPLDLVVGLLDALAARTGLDPARVDDVVLGCAGQVGDQGGNLARTAALMAGWPEAVPGQTVNRFCASGIDAVALGAALVRSGQAELVVAGGVESSSRVPMFADKGPLWTDPAVVDRIGSVHMGIAADVVATEEGRERGELDEYGVRTQERAARAWAEGRFSDGVVPVTAADGTVLLAADEHVRPGTTLEQLSGLEAAFAELGASGQDELALRHLPHLKEVRHLHTRGTSPSLADGACLTLIGTARQAERLGLTPVARIAASASAGCDPVRMLVAGQTAVGCALERAGLASGDVDVVEYAEAFAALCLKIQRDLGFGDDRFNVNGGTIAMGHAFGATGAILVGACADELRRSGGTFGVAAVSGAAGLGTAVVLEAAG